MPRIFTITSDYPNELITQLNLDRIERVDVRPEDGIGCVHTFGGGSYLLKSPEATLELIVAWRNGRGS